MASQLVVEATSYAWSVRKTVNEGVNRCVVRFDKRLLSFKEIRRGNPPQHQAQPQTGRASDKAGRSLSEASDTSQIGLEDSKHYNEVEPQIPHCPLKDFPEPPSDRTG